MIGAIQSGIVPRHQPVAAPELPNPHLWFSTSPRSREARAYRHARRNSRCRRPLSSAAMSGDSAGLAAGIGGSARGDVLHSRAP